MDDIDDVVRRLRHRASNSRAQERSLDAKAADALDRLLLERGQRGAERSRSEQRRSGTAAPATTADAPDRHRRERDRRTADSADSEQRRTGAGVCTEAPDGRSVTGDPPGGPASTEEPPRASPMTDRALNLREAAALLGISYATAYAHRKQLGFFQVGSVWRVWPEKLREATNQHASDQSAQKEQESMPCQSENVRALTRGTSISARQAVVELDKLLARSTAKKHRSTTTS